MIVRASAGMDELTVQVTRRRRWRLVNPSNASTSTCGEVTSIAPPTSVNRQGERVRRVMFHSPSHTEGISLVTSTCWVASSGLPGYQVVGMTLSIGQEAPRFGNPPPRSSSVRMAARF